MSVIKFLRKWHLLWCFQVSRRMIWGFPRCVMTMAWSTRLSNLNLMWRINMWHNILTFCSVFIMASVLPTNAQLATWIRPEVLYFYISRIRNRKAVWGDAGEDLGHIILWCGTGVLVFSDCCGHFGHFWGVDCAGNGGIIFQVGRTVSG